MEKKKVVRKKKAPKKHIVVFQDDQGNVLKTTFVNDGADAEPPVMQEILEEKEHHRIIFKGWDQKIICVQSNLVVNPVYEEVPKEYLIMYLHENGKILGTETVLYGHDACKEIIPGKDETEEFVYHFSGWNCSLEHIEKDLMAKAVFRAERKSFPVRFFGGDGKLMNEQMIPYGQPAQPPAKILKEADKTFRYHFSGWDDDFSYINGAKDIHALFQEEYIDYTIRFFEEEDLIEEKTYHYNDRVEYPAMRKKGYDFVWDLMIYHVEESQDISGYWEYSNPKGKRIIVDGNQYEITNPSITAGTVRCLEYHSKGQVVTIPERVKLGDYYYNVDSLGSRFLSGCINARSIICPNSIRSLEDYCFAENTKIENITLGKGIQAFGAGVFAGCSHLKKITLESRKVNKVHRDTFEKIPFRVEMKVMADQKNKLIQLMRRGVQNKQLIIC